MTDTIARGMRAEREMTELDLAFATLRERMLEEIATSAIGHHEKREKLYMGVQSLDAVRKALISVRDAGLVEKSREERSYAAQQSLSTHTDLIRPNGA